MTSMTDADGVRWKDERLELPAHFSATVQAPNDPVCTYLCAIRQNGQVQDRWTWEVNRELSSAEHSEGLSESAQGIATSHAVALRNVHDAIRFLVGTRK